MMSKGKWSFILAIAFAVSAYLTLWPVPVDPVAWNAPRDNGYTGEFEVNHRLANLEFIDLSRHSGPEDAALGRDGKIYAATQDGSIVKIDLQAGTADPVAMTGGRPLGVTFGQDGRLYIADAFKGLMVMEPDGKLTLLADRTADGSVIAYANSLDITPSGVIYFTDASSKFGAAANGGTLEASLLDLMEHGPHGRILKYVPETGKAYVVAEGLSFANGLALSDDNRFLLVNETGTYSVLRLWLSGPGMGELETIVANLPGFPDNLKRDDNNTFWLGLASPRSAPVDILANWPFLRKVVQRLPAVVRPKPQRYGMVVHIDGNGQILETLQDPAGEYALNTGALRGPNGELVVTSLTEPRLGYLKAGWE